VVDVKRGQATAPMNVIVDKGRIADVGAAPRGVDVPARGLFLVPGLIDCHSHILSPFLTRQEGFLGAWTMRQIGRNLRTNLASGVVLVLDMLSPIRIMNKVRWLLERGTLQGPTIRASGAIMSCEGGYPEFITPIPWPLGAIIGSPKYHLSSTDDARAMVNYLYKCGADHIKIGYTSRPRDFYGPEMPVVSTNVLRTICDTAHALNLKVAVHHNWTCDIEPILEADVDSLEHQCNDALISDAHVELIKKKGVAVTPTLTVGHNMSYFDQKSEFMRSQAARELFEPQAVEHLTFITETWLDKNETSYDDVFGYWRANHEVYDRATQTTRKLSAAGVNILCGTDFGAVTAFSGETSDEVRRLAMHGLGNLEALRAATLRAAEHIGVAADYGSIEPGKRADFFLVEGNPLEDIAALRNVRMVAKSGRWFRAGGDTTTPMFNKGYEFK
jgi:imidazolonepropionase-like amidohydrolase